MSSTLNVTKQLTNEGWVVTANVSAGGSIPRENFLYENTGTVSLGEYQGVVTVVDLPRIQIWNFQVIPVLGNKYVRHSSATLIVPKDTDPDSVISRLKVSVQQFSKDFQATPTSSQTFSIT